MNVSLAACTSSLKILIMASDTWLALYPSSMTDGRVRSTTLFNASLDLPPRLAFHIALELHWTLGEKLLWRR